MMRSVLRTLVTSWVLVATTIRPVRIAMPLETETFARERPH